MSIPRKWTSLIGKEDDTDDRLWVQNHPPTELSILPQKHDISPKLLEILQWSLEHHDPVSPASVGSIVTEVPGTVRIESEHGGITPEHGIDRTDKYETPNDTPSTIPSHDTVSKSSPLSIALGRIAALKARHAAQVSQATKLSKTSKSNDAPAELVECTSCFDEMPVSSLIRLSCTHYYCKVCLGTLILTAIANEASYPPKCCLTEIPLACIVKSLDQKQLGQYKGKAAEYSVPTNRRWYCPNAACGKWIPPSKLRVISVSQKCLACSTKICTECRGQAHARRADCPRDHGLEATINLAESHGWRRCYRCRAMVERSVGCRHMTCHCGAQFCYVCGVPWRTCSCTELDEANRQMELQRRRMAAQTQEEEEEEHLRRSIAVVRAIEAREAQERRRREAEEAELLRIEQEQLVQLERQRLEEEERRLQQEWALEQELKQILEASLRMEGAALLETLMEVIQLQHIALDDKQGRREQEIVGKYEAAVEEHKRRRATVGQKMEAGTDTKLERLKGQHEEAKLQLIKQHEEQQDELFMKIQHYLKNKPNKEKREQKMLLELQDSQRLETHALNQKLDLAYRTAEALNKRELDTLLRAVDAKLVKAKAEHGASMKEFILRASIERKWYVAISERRLEMVKQHNAITAHELAEGLEPVGLTSERAATVQPLPALRLGPLNHFPFSSARASAEIHEGLGNNEQQFPSCSSRSMQSDISFVSAGECLPRDTPTDASKDSDTSADPDAVLADLSLLDGFDPSNCSARAARGHVRNLTPPHELDLPRNGPAFIAAKSGEPSNPRDSCSLPDTSPPPTPPDSPPLPPAGVRLHRKPVPMYIRDGPEFVSPKSTTPARRPSIPLRPSESGERVVVDGPSPDAPQMSSHTNNLPAPNSSSQPRVLKPLRQKPPKLSEKQRQKARSASSSTVDSQVSTRIEHPPSPLPSTEAQRTPADTGKADTKLRHKASRMWPFKRTLT